MLRTHRVRADTTVVAATVCYPTDAGLLGRAIGKLAATIGRIQATGAATRTRVRDRRRSARRRAHQLAKTLRGRSEQANQAVLCTTGELATLATQAVGDATRVARNARRSLARAAAIPASSTARDPRVAGPAVPVDRRRACRMRLPATCGKFPGVRAAFGGDRPQATHDYRHRNNRSSRGGGHEGA